MSDWDKKWKNSTKPASAFEEHKSGFDSWRRFLTEQDTLPPRKRPYDPDATPPMFPVIVPEYPSEEPETGPRLNPNLWGRATETPYYDAAGNEIRQLDIDFDGIPDGLDTDNDSFIDTVHPHHSAGFVPHSDLPSPHPEGEQYTHGDTWAQHQARQSWDLSPEESSEIDYLNQAMRASQLRAIEAYRDSYGLREDGDHGTGAHAWLRYIQEELLADTSVEPTQENAIKYYSAHILPQVDAVLSEDRVFAATNRHSHSPHTTGVAPKEGGRPGVHTSPSELPFNRRPQTQSEIYMDAAHLEDNIDRFGTLDDVMGHELGHSLGFMINPYVGMNDVELSLRWVARHRGMMDDYEAERAKTVAQQGEELATQIYDEPGLVGTFGNFGTEEGSRVNLADDPVFSRSMEKIQDDKMGRLYGEEDVTDHSGRRTEQLGSGYWKNAQLNRRYREEQQLPPEQRTVTTNRWTAEQLDDMRRSVDKEAYTIETSFDDVDSTAGPAEPAEKQSKGWFKRILGALGGQDDAEANAPMTPDRGMPKSTVRYHYPSVIDWEDARESDRPEGRSKIHTFQTSDIEDALKQFGPEEEELSNEEAAEIMNTIARDQTGRESFEPEGSPVEAGATSTFAEHRMHNKPTSAFGEHKSSFDSWRSFLADEGAADVKEERTILNEQSPAGPTPLQRLQNAYRGADYRLGGYLPQGITPSYVQSTNIPHTPHTMPSPLFSGPGEQTATTPAPDFTSPAPIHYDPNPLTGPMVNRWFRSQAGLSPEPAPALTGPEAVIPGAAPWATTQYVGGDVGGGPPVTTSAFGPSSEAPSPEEVTLAQMDAPRSWTDDPAWADWVSRHGGGLANFDPSQVMNWSWSGMRPIPGYHTGRHLRGFGAPTGPPGSVEYNTQMYPGVDPATLAPDWEQYQTAIDTNDDGVPDAQIARPGPSLIPGMVGGGGGMATNFLFQPGVSDWTTRLYTGPHMIPIRQAMGEQDRGMRLENPSGTEAGIHSQALNLQGTSDPVAAYDTGANAQAWVDHLNDQILPGTTWEGRGEEYFAQYIWPQYMEATNLIDLTGGPSTDFGPTSTSDNPVLQGFTIDNTDDTAAWVPTEGTPAGTPLLMEPATMAGTTGMGPSSAQWHPGLNLMRIDPDALMAQGSSLQDVASHEIWHARGTGREDIGTFIDPFVGLLGTDEEGRPYERPDVQARLQGMRDQGSYMHDVDQDGVAETPMWSIGTYQLPHLQHIGFSPSPGGTGAVAGSGHFGDTHDHSASGTAHEDLGEERLAAFLQWRDLDQEAGGTGRLTPDMLEWIDTAGASGTDPMYRIHSAGLTMDHGIGMDASGHLQGEFYNALRGVLGHDTAPGASTWGQLQSGESPTERFDRILGPEGLEQIIGRDSPGSGDWSSEAEEEGWASEDIERVEDATTTPAEREREDDEEWLSPDDAGTFAESRRHDGYTQRLAERAHCDNKPTSAFKEHKDAFTSWRKFLKG